MVWLSWNRIWNGRRAEAWGDRPIGHGADSESCSGGAIGSVTEVDELTSYGAVVDGDWMRVVAERDRKELSRMQLLLDSGEGEAIVVAIEICAGLLLADGRREKAARGLRVTGILGVLAHAKERGLISSCGSVLDEMIVHAGFLIGVELRVQLLSWVGEAP